jgi:hypothetical protein
MGLDAVLTIQTGQVLSPILGAPQRPAPGPIPAPRPRDDDEAERPERPKPHWGKGPAPDCARPVGVPPAAVTSATAST